MGIQHLGIVACADLRVSQARPRSSRSGVNRRRCHHRYMIPIGHIAITGSWFVAEEERGRAMARDAEIEVEDHEGRWVEVPSLSDSGPNDRHYVVMREDTGVSVRFGDGRHGRRPPTGETNVRAVYRSGLGSTGDVSLAVTLQRPSRAPTEDQALWAVIRDRTEALSFETYSHYPAQPGRARPQRRRCGWWSAAIAFVAGLLAGRRLGSAKS
jgi:hypothetical protein